MGPVEDFFSLINDFTWGWALIPLLVVFGIFITVLTGFVQLRYFKRMFRVLTGADGTDDPNAISGREALLFSVGGRVGCGNIAGVALAIHLGGPAALFWMLVTAMVGMTTKFVEVTLSHKYREFTEDGTAAGGPMYYMKNRLNMKWMAALFALATIVSSFGTGNMPQINSISNSMQAAFGIHPAITGLVLAIPLTAFFVVFWRLAREKYLPELV